MESKKLFWVLLVFMTLMFLGAAILHAQGPVASYGFNEGSGTAVTDASGNNNSGALSGATWTTGGKFGGALTFNGTSSKVTIPDSASLRLTNRWTLEAWISPSIIPTDDNMVLGKGNTNWYIAHISQGRVIGGGLVGTTWREVYGTTALPVNVWVHVALTYDGAILRLYQNAVEVRNNSFAVSFAVTTKALEIGWNSADASQYFSGKIDEIRIYNRALTKAEVQTDMNTPVGSVTPPADTLPPVISAGSPTGVLAAGTTQATLSVVTNENSTCRYATTAGTAYTSMLNTFLTTGLKAHSTLLAGLVGGGSYNYFVRCIDGSGNANSSDYSVSFSVALPPPIVSIDSHPDAPIQVTWDYDPNYQAQVSGFSLYASDNQNGPWTFYNGIADPTKRLFSLISPDKNTYFTMDACKQSSPTAGFCSAKSNVILVRCLPVTETFLWQTYTVRACR